MDGPQRISPDHPLYASELELRFRVLREPLGFTRADVPFPFERESLHWVLVRDGAVVGCVLFHPEAEATGRLFQMAVRRELQGQGLGRALVGALEAHVRAEGFQEVTLHARQEAIGFYERLGYSVYGEPYEEVGVPHRHMRKRLNPGG